MSNDGIDIKGRILRGVQSSGRILSSSREVIATIYPAWAHLIAQFGLEGEATYYASGSATLDSLFNLEATGSAYKVSSSMLEVITTLEAEGIRVATATATLPVVTTLGAEGVLTLVSASDLLATFGFTSDGTYVGGGTATLAIDTQLSSSGTITASGVATMAMIATLSAIPSGVVYQGGATLDVVSSLTATMWRLVRGTVDPMDAEFNMASSGNRVAGAQGTLFGEFGLEVGTTNVFKEGSATLDAVSSIAIDATASFVSGSSLENAFHLASDAFLLFNGMATLSSTFELTSEAIRTATGDSTLAVDTTMDSSAVKVANADGTLDAEFDLASNAVALIGGDAQLDVIAGINGMPTASYVSGSTMNAVTNLEAGGDIKGFEGLSIHAFVEDTSTNIHYWRWSSFGGWKDLGVTSNIVTNGQVTDIIYNRIKDVAEYRTQNHYMKNVGGVSFTGVNLSGESTAFPTLTIDKDNNAHSLTHATSGTARFFNWTKIDQDGNVLDSETLFSGDTTTGTWRDVGFGATLLIDQNNKVHITCCHRERVGEGWVPYYHTNASGSWVASELSPKYYNADTFHHILSKIFNNKIYACFGSATKYWMFIYDLETQTWSNEEVASHSTSPRVSGLILNPDNTIEVICRVGATTRIATRTTGGDWSDTQFHSALLGIGVPNNEGIVKDPYGVYRWLARTGTNDLSHFWLDTYNTVNSDLLLTNGQKNSMFWVSHTWFVWAASTLSATTSLSAFPIYKASALGALGAEFDIDATATFVTNGDATLDAEFAIEARGGFVIEGNPDPLPVEANVTAAGSRMILGTSAMEAYAGLTGSGIYVGKTLSTLTGEFGFSAEGEVIAGMPIPASGLIAWHKASDLSSTYSDGDTVLTWADASSEGYDLTSSSGVLFRPNGNTYSYPTAHVTGNATLQGSGRSETSGQYTCILVLDSIIYGTWTNGNTVNGGYDVIDQIYMENSFYAYQQRKRSCYNYSCSFTNQNIVFMSSYSTATFGAGSNTIVVEATKSEYFRNNSSVSSYNHSGLTYGDTQIKSICSAVATDKARGWRAYLGNGFHVIEHILYDRALSSEERTSIEDYIQTQYPDLP